MARLTALALLALAACTTPEVQAPAPTPKVPVVTAPPPPAELPPWHRGFPVIRQNRTFFVYRDGSGPATLAVREADQAGFRDLLTGEKDLGLVQPSPDGNFLAFTTAGGLRILDVRSGFELLETLPPGEEISLRWRTDSKGFYYSREGGRIFYHRLGTDGSRDPWIPRLVMLH